MSRILKYFLVISVLVLTVVSLSFAQRFDRTAQLLPNPDLEVGGFGNVVAGVDHDGDGYKEVYFVNNDWQDAIGKDLVPRIYKYEKNDQGGWDQVWYTRLPFDFQNTWPAMASADLDKDGKGEIVWGPVNNFGGGLNPNPSRIVVFETPGDGSDDMGVWDETDSLWMPNAQWTITEADGEELRPFKWFINDIDDDGTDEIVAALRTATQRGAVYSVDDIPDAADGSETWTLEWEGLGDGPAFPDLAIIDSTIYYVGGFSGDIIPVTYSASGDSFRVDSTQTGLVPGGSWLSAQSADIDEDGTMEILVASWLDNPDKRVWVLTQDADTLKANLIADFSDVPDIRRLNGGDIGDIDGDGYLDYVIGTRDFDTPQENMNHVVRVGYKGGDITDPASYKAEVIDKNVLKKYNQGTQMDVVTVANVDDDPEDEVFFAGPTRPFASGGPPVLPVVELNMVPMNQPKITNVLDVPNDQGRHVFVMWRGSADDVPGMRMTANLSGANVLPADGGPVTTPASGKATFVLDEENERMHFMLEVYNIDSVTAAHIHIGGPDESGGVALPLYSGTAGGPVNGILAAGMLTPDDLTGDFAGDPDGFADVLLAGETYVNVHTTTHAPGEIRGQVLTDPLTRSISPAETEGFDITHYIVWRIDKGVPNQVAKVDAIQAPMYAAVVPTLADGDSSMFRYVVSAHTPNTTVLWKSLPQAGFSLDNLVPTAPTNMMANVVDTQVELAWDESPDPDFKYFSIRRSTQDGFDPSNPATEIATTTSTNFLDANVEAGESYFYRVVAFDFNNNQGNFSDQVSTTITSLSDGDGNLPKEFALRQNYPNPFNPETHITFDLPKQSDVTIVIYNSLGQKVRTLVNEGFNAGSHNVIWNGRNDNGVQVAGGIYIYRLKAGEFVDTKKMTFLK